MRRGNPDVHQTPTIQVIERMFSLIDVLASREDSMSLKDISEQTGLHPSTAHRILNDLTIGRFVDRPEAGSYRLGMRLLELGNLVKARLSVRDAALVPMRDLHRLIQQPVNLSVRQGDEIVYIERAYSERSGMQVVRAIGGRAPLHWDNVIKAIAAFERTLISAGSCYDQAPAGQLTLSAQEQRGQQLFFGPKALCASCTAAPTSAAPWPAPAAPSARPHSTTSACSTSAAPALIPSRTAACLS